MDNFNRFTKTFTPEQKAAFYKELLAFCRDAEESIVNNIYQMAEEYGHVKYGMGLSDCEAQRKQTINSLKKKKAQPNRNRKKS